MVKSSTVKPRRWANLSILSDDGTFAYAYGVYHHDNGNSTLELAGRWNGGGNSTSVGFPSQGGNPTWFVLDHSMISPILAELEKRAIVKGDFVAVTTILDARKAFRV